MMQGWLLESGVWSCPNPSRRFTYSLRWPARTWILSLKNQKSHSCQLVTSLTPKPQQWDWPWWNSQLEADWTTSTHTHYLRIALDRLFGEFFWQKLVDNCRFGAILAILLPCHQLNLTSILLYWPQSGLFEGYSSWEILHKGQRRLSHFFRKNRMEIAGFVDVDGSETTTVYMMGKTTNH